MVLFCDRSQIFGTIIWIDWLNKELLSLCLLLGLVLHKLQARILSLMFLVIKFIVSLKICKMQEFIRSNLQLMVWDNQLCCSPPNAHPFMVTLNICVTYFLFVWMVWFFIDFPSLIQSDEAQEAEVVQVLGAILELRENQAVQTPNTMCHIYFTTAMMHLVLNNFEKVSLFFQYLCQFSELFCY